MSPAQLGYRAGRIFLQLIDGLKLETGEAKKLDNAPALFMPLHVEVIHAGSDFAQISFAHYGEQNGDAMRDPEMIFLYRFSDIAINVFPTYFRNDYLGLETESAAVNRNGKIERFHPKLQRDHALFARQWMRNIKAQQIK